MSIVEEAIRDGVIDYNIKVNSLEGIALQLYIDSLDIDSNYNYDLKEFSDINDLFMNISTYDCALDDYEGTLEEIGLEE